MGEMFVLVSERLAGGVGSGGSDLVWVASDVGAGRPEVLFEVGLQALPDGLERFRAATF
jgi:hypothetical protein